MDLDNCLKVAIDALQGIGYLNDKQVKRITLEYGTAVPDGGLTITLAILTIQR